MDPMNRMRPAALAVVLLAFTSVPARADLTAFIGPNTTPANRQVRGAALGMGLRVIRFEL